MSVSKCMNVVNRLTEADQTELLERIERLQVDEGVGPNKAAVEVATAMLADLQNQAFMEPVRSVSREATDTPEFKRWFGDSKVVNPDGTPKVVYHGSLERGITEFDTTRETKRGNGDQAGTYFTTVPETAAGYTRPPIEFGKPFKGQRGSVTAAYLSLQNPLNTTADIKRGLKRGLSFGDAKREALKKLDRSVHDGIMFDGAGPAAPELVAFKPSQIKSATDNSGAFDPSSADITRSAERPLFFSQLEVAIGDVPDRLATMSAPQWKLWLDANAAKMGVKKDEVEWSGIKDFLDLRGKDKVTRDELVAYLADSGVRVQEVVLGYEPPLVEGYYIVDHNDGTYDVRSGSGSDAVRNFRSRAEAQNWIDEKQDDEAEAGDNRESETKYGTYTVPGGENYREVLITLPERGAEQYTRGNVEPLPAGDPAASQPDYFWYFKVPGNVLQIPKSKFADQVDARDYIIREKQPPAPAGKNYRSSHWDGQHPNILAHLRVDDRTDADGNKVLFINEIQSDWGQDGKKKGFAGDGELTQADYSKAMQTLRDIATENDNLGFDSTAQAIGALAGHSDWRNRWDVGGPENEAAVAEALRVRDQLGKQKAGALVPRAPFVQDTKAWASLAMKRAIMMAVDGGYDKIALITGEQAANLYSLDKQLDSLAYQPSQNAHGVVVGFQNGTAVISKNVDSDAELADIVGKEVAERLLGIKPDKKGQRWLRGDGLRIEALGMRAFYDQIIPQVARDVLKKLGGGGLTSVDLAEERFSGGISGVDVMKSLGIQPSKYNEYWSNLDAEKREELIEAERVRLSQAKMQPGFDITPTMRDKVAAGVPLFSKPRDLDAVRLAGGYTLGDLMKSSKKISWWDKTVGSMFNLAEKQPQFKRVYDEVQNFIGDISKYATRASDLAPTIIPQLETLSDIARKPLSVEDTKALAGPVFEGTLLYTRDDDGNAVRTDDVGLAGVVWRSEELRTLFNLDDRQISLYRETRKAINKSLTDLSITDMLRYAGKDADGVRSAVLEATTADHAAKILAQEFERLAEETPERRSVLEDSARGVKEKANMTHGLIAKGYAPLSRYGDFTVYVTKDDGKEQVFFGMYETEREANKAARAWAAEEPEAKVSTGTMSKESYKLFKGVTPETLALFGESLGLEEGATDRESQVFQAYLKAAKTNRSAMKRMIERKGVSGYSEDVGRVLAGFVYSNARQASTNLHAGAISKAAADISAGDLKDQAIRLVEYVQNPAEEAQAMRGLLFANYIGGSIASALVNLTQTATTTWPVLSQHYGVAKSAAALNDAVRVASKGAGSDSDLADAMKRAEEEGITAPQETHHLQAQAAGRSSLASGDGTNVGDFLAKAGNAKNKIMLVWGKAFGWAEQMNRKIAFAAAYKLARDRGDSDPFGFAKKTVAETQYTMNKGNNQVWARGPVGATLFTFRKFSVNYLEGLARMWGSGPEGKRAFALSLGVMFLLAGTAGFPFAEDLDDAIDFVAQRVLGKNFHSKEAKRQFFADILGREGAEFVMQGISGVPGVPIDVSGRLGMGNVIPGTGMLQKKREYGSDMKEIAGAAGDFLGRLATATAATAQGDFRRAAEEAAPTALKNAAKAMQMAQLGYYTDSKGRKVIDTTLSEAVLKGIGFQPSGVAQVQESTRAQQLLIDLNKVTEGEIADIWARGRIERKPELVEQAKARLDAWNKANPTSPISIDAAQINRRVQQANMNKAQRIAATAPREIREAVKRELAPQP